MRRRSIREDKPDSIWTSSSSQPLLPEPRCRVLTAVGLALRVTWHRIPRVLWAVIGLSLILNATGAWWGVFEGATVSWAGDELSPRMLYRALSMKFSGGWHERYPPLHFYALTAAYGPIIALHVFDIIDLGTGTASAILFLIGRSINIGLSLGILLALYGCARELKLSQSAGVIACLFLALSVPFVFYSKTLNVEVPYVFWFVVSIWFFLRALEHHGLADHLLFAVTATLAVSTKDQAYGLYALTVPYLWLASIAHDRRGGSDLGSATADCGSPPLSPSPCSH